jgi:hypothetical protein
MSELWFTTATSTSLLEHGSAYSGLYKCSLDEDTGKCQTPQVLANSWYRDGRLHHDMPMMNVQLDLSKESEDDEPSSGFVYSRTYDKERNSWEIIRAKIAGGGSFTEPLYFESFFRTDKTIEWNECGWKCCEAVGNAYIGLTPKSYFVEEGDVFVSWDGFYKNCQDNWAPSSEHLVWTVGVSRLKNDSSCILNGDGESRNFALCTEVVSIVNQDKAGRSVVLPFGGFSAARSPPSNERIFFMSAMRSEGIDMGVLSNELWVFPEGGDFTKAPHLLQTFAPVHIHELLFDDEIQDGGSIRLHFSDDGAVDHICRTAFDHSVSCFPVAFHETGDLLVKVELEHTFVDSVQIEQTCSIDLFTTKSYNNKAASVTTGLDVQWDANGQPEKIFFGCFGGVGGKGNFTVADRNGEIFTTLPGAFPGSIVAFGSTHPTLFSRSRSEADPRGSRLIPRVGWGIAMVCVVATTLFAYRSRRAKTRKRGGCFKNKISVAFGLSDRDALLGVYDDGENSQSQQNRPFLELAKGSTMCAL